jgi:hypothetical protein
MLWIVGYAIGFAIGFLLRCIWLLLRTILRGLEELSRKLLGWAEFGAVSNHRTGNHSMIADEDAKKIADAVFDKFLRYLTVAGSLYVLCEAINKVLEPPLTHFVYIGTAGVGAWLYYVYLKNRPKSAPTLPSIPPEARSYLPPVVNHRSSAFNRATGRYEEV